MTAAAYREQFEFGNVLAQALAALRRNLPVLATLTLLLFGLPKLGATLLESSVVNLPVFGGMFETTGSVYEFFALIGYFVLQAAVVHVLVKDLAGQTPALGGALRAGVNVFFPVLIVSVLTMLAVILGLILLIVPGLMIATALLVATPAVVVERTGVTGAFERSRWLTRGYRWPVFGLMALMFLISAVIDGAIGNAPMITFGIGLIEDAARLVSEVFEDLFHMALALASALLVSSIYCELRRIKEAASPEMIAEDLH